MAELVVRVWAQALFCSPLRPQDRPDQRAVCATVIEELARYTRMPGGCAGAVAQQAGDYPELFAERMTWCLEQAAGVYAVRHWSGYQAT
ncbi:hypothetical protein ACFV3E_46155 [Streptomyces sp. NPDC059718]